MPGLSCVACLGAVRSRLTVSTADAIHDKRLVRVLIDEQPPAVPVSLIYPGQGRLPMKTRAFIAYATNPLRDRLSKLSANEGSAQ
jgi:DNA-binding transcriptional LysR family regulator